MKTLFLALLGLVASVSFNLISVRSASADVLDEALFDAATVAENGTGSTGNGEGWSCIIRCDLAMEYKKTFVTDYGWFGKSTSTDYTTSTKVKAIPGKGIDAAEAMMSAVSNCENWAKTLTASSGAADYSVRAQSPRILNNYHQDSLVCRDRLHKNVIGSYDCRSYTEAAYQEVSITDCTRN